MAKKPYNWTIDNNRIDNPKGNRNIRAPWMDEPLNLTTLPAMHHVVSSNIESVGLDEKTQTAFIRFKGGGLYAYFGVDKKEFENLKNAESVGKYFYRFWRAVFPYKKLDVNDFTVTSKIRDYIRRKLKMK